MGDNETYYAGKNNECKEFDTFIFKKVAAATDKTVPFIASLKHFKGYMMAIYLQNQAILSSLRRINDRLDDLEAKLNK